MILSDFDLRNYILTGRLRVEPFNESIIRENGLDLRLGNEYCLIRDSYDVLDLTSANISISNYYDCETNDVILLEPGRRYLLTTLEYLMLPPELMGFVELRSTYARLGMIIPPTIVDGGFEGQLTIELLTPPFPIKIKPGVRFLHVVFAKLTTPILRPYKGKYQGQRGVTLPRFSDRDT